METVSMWLARMKKQKIRKNDQGKQQWKQKMFYEPIDSQINTSEKEEKMTTEKPLPPFFALQSQELRDFFSHPPPRNFNMNFPKVKFAV